MTSPCDPAGPQFVSLAALPHGRRVLVRLQGADVRRFLQGILSADVHAARPGTAVPAAILTVKGKIVSDAILLAYEDEALALALPGEVAEETIGVLDRHIIMDDVALVRDDAAALAMAWSVETTDPRIARFAASYPAPGTLLVGPAEALSAALAGARELTLSEWNLRRIEAAAPAWGLEIGPGMFPPEVGFVAAVSYTKGCYLGQEPLARIHARGQVNRVMVRVHAETCPEGPVELSAPDRPQAGSAATWAPDPTGGALGLAIVHRSAASPGTILHAEGLGPVEVRSGPLGDDPGVARSRA
ncbi:MAG TPA: hypothetical protein VIK91_19070 [Nannocystis sp.]